MGSSNSRTLNLKNVNEHYANSEIIGNRSTFLSIQPVPFMAKSSVLIIKAWILTLLSRSKKIPIHRLIPYRYIIL